MRRLFLAAALVLPLVVAPLALAQDAPPAPPTPPAPGAPDAPPDPTIGRPARPPMTPQMRQAVQAMRTACAADMARLCGDAAAGQPPAEGQDGGQPGGQRGRGGAMRCMMQHAADVSPPCAQAIGAVRALRHADHG